MKYLMILLLSCIRKRFKRGVKALKLFSQKNPSQARTAVFVILLHTTLLLAFYYYRPPITVIKPQRRIAVKTVKLAPKKIKPQQKKSAVTAAKPQKKENQKKEKKKTPIAKKKSPPPKKVQKKKDVADKETIERLAKQKELLKRAQESLKKVDDKKSLASSEPLFQPPSTITFLENDDINEKSSTPMKAKDLAYCEELVDRLRLVLRLPDYGQVEVKITLNRDGDVIKSEIVKSQNVKNQEYLKQMLPTLSLVPFDNNFPGEKNHTFLLILENDV